MHFQTEIIRNHGNYIEIKKKTKTNTNKRIKKYKSQGDFALMRYET